MVYCLLLSPSAYDAGGRLRWARNDPHSTHNTRPRMVGAGGCAKFSIVSTMCNGDPSGHCAVSRGSWQGRYVAILRRGVAREWTGTCRVQRCKRSLVVHSAWACCEGAHSTLKHKLPRVAPLHLAGALLYYLHTDRSYHPIAAALQPRTPFCSEKTRPRSRRRDVVDARTAADDSSEPTRGHSAGVQLIRVTE